MNEGVPGFQSFMRPLLETLAQVGRPMRASEAYEALAERMRLGPEVRAQRIPSGQQPAYKNRIGWASTYLRFAGLVHAPSRGVWEITESDREFLGRHAGEIDLRVLGAIPAYREWKIASEKARDEASDAPDDTDEPATEATPEEVLHGAHRRIVDRVAEDLAGHLERCSPSFFEELVLDLLNRMGYGTTADSRHVGRSGDGGIDGIISLDRLGLEKIYVQAKKWQRDARIGRPEIQGFYGALAGQKGTKGLFITTASFSKEAEAYAANVSGSLILVDGRRLVQLMIDHGVGVAVARTLAVPKVDLDYFE